MKPGQTSPWQPLQVIGLPCHNKYLRLRTPWKTRNDKVIVDSQAPEWVTLPAGAIGYCVNKSVGTIRLGFTRDFTPAPPRHSIVDYDYVIPVGLADMWRFEIQA